MKTTLILRFYHNEKDRIHPWRLLILTPFRYNSGIKGLREIVSSWCRTAIGGNNNSLWIECGTGWGFKNQNDAMLCLLTWDG